MPRPIKNNADYFSHDADMRNDRKIKALRAKFGLEGYAVWCMLLETITDVENFQIEINDIEYELIAGDFGIDADKLKTIILYLSELNLLCIDNNILHCPKLTERLSPVIEKRKRDTEYRNRKKQVNGNDNAINGIENPINGIESTQSKVKESKVKENINTDSLMRTSATPSLDEVREFVQMHNLAFSAEAFFHHHEGTGWKIGNSAITNWRAIALKWQQKESSFNKKPHKNGQDSLQSELQQIADTDLKGVANA